VCALGEVDKSLQGSVCALGEVDKSLQGSVHWVKWISFVPHC